MPTQTYLNLSEEKKERVESAIKKEFTRVPLLDISIKNIVLDANIARGSFYQYFEDREDAIKYIIKKEFIKERDKILLYLTKNSMDPFDTAYDYLKNSINYNKDEIAYYTHIAEYLKEYEVSKIKALTIEDVNKYLGIDITKCNYTEEDLRTLLKMLCIITNVELISIINGITSKEEGLKSYKKQLEILRKGTDYETKMKNINTNI